jgi:hypothetical protein
MEHEEVCLDQGSPYALQNWTFAQESAILYSIKKILTRKKLTYE